MPQNTQEDIRIAFKVEPELKSRITSKLEWGQLKLLYTAITKDLATLLEDNDPSVVVAAILSENLSLTDILESKKIRDKRNATS